MEQYTADNILKKLEAIEKKNFQHFLWGVFFSAIIGIIITASFNSKIKS